MVPVQIENFSILARLEKCLSDYPTFGGEGLRPPDGGRGTWFQKFEKASYKTVVQIHIENFSTLGLHKNISCIWEVTLQMYTAEISVSSICIK